MNFDSSTKLRLTTKPAIATYTLLAVSMGDYLDTKLYTKNE